MKAERADQQDAGSAALVMRDSVGERTSGTTPTKAPTTTVPEVHARVEAAPSSGGDTRAVSNFGAPSGLGARVDTPTAGPGKAAVLVMGTTVALPWLEWFRDAPTTRVSVPLSEAQELIAAGVLAELELLRGAQRATDSAALLSPPTVPSVVPPSMTGIGVGSGTLGTMTTLGGVI